MGKSDKSIKTLVLGLDGFDSGWIHLAPKFFKKANLSVLKDNPEDLLVRGWSKFLIGSDAYRLNACYNRPVFNGSYNRTSSVNGNVNKQSTNYLGAKEGVDLLFFPTLSPVIRSPKTSRISAPGGGVDPTGSITETSCSNNSVLSAARDKSIWEVRVSNYKNVEIASFLQVLETEVKESIDIFRRLTEKNDSNTSCLMLRFYESIIGQFGEVLTEKGLIHAPEEVRKLLDVVDEELSKLLEVYDYKELFVISDHGMTPLMGYLNLNEYLTGTTKAGAAKGIQPVLLEFMKKLLGSDSFGQLIKIKRKISKKSLTKFNGFNESDSWIAYRYISGLYKNDSRFSARKIVEMELSKSYRLRDELPSVSIIPISSKFSIVGDAFPDYWVEMEEGWFPENSGISHRVKHNTDYQNITCIDQYRATKRAVSFLGHNSEKELNSLEDLNSYLLSK